MFDVFFSHDWGKDELDRDHHSCVEEINTELEAAEVLKWLDGDQMWDKMNKAMSEDIVDSKIIIVFLTANFIKKESVKRPRGEDNNCFFEFDSALLERGRWNIMTVVK